MRTGMKMLDPFSEFSENVRWVLLRKRKCEVGVAMLKA
jgi:hypothetical protein